MEFKITNTQVYGLERAIKASGNPMRVEIDTSEMTDKDFVRATKLGNAKSGEGHDNFLKGILVQMDVAAPLFWWKQAQRYHWFDFISSQSTMHCLLKFDIAKQCVSDTNSEIVRIVSEVVKEYLSLSEDDSRKKTLWREIVASLPCGFCLGATMTTNYQQLKTMYMQRRYHKLNEWRLFVEWCDTLPHFQELTGVTR